MNNGTPLETAFDCPVSSLTSNESEAPLGSKFSTPAAHEQSSTFTMFGAIRRRPLFLDGRLTALAGISVKPIEGIDPAKKIRLQQGCVAMTVEFTDNGYVDYFVSEKGEPDRMLRAIELVFGRTIYDVEEWRALSIEIENAKFLGEIQSHPRRLPTIREVAANLKRFARITIQWLREVRP